MRFAIVIPSHDFDEVRSLVGCLINNIDPTLIPEKVARENPVLAEAHFRPVMGREPGRRG